MLFILIKPGYGIFQVFPNRISAPWITSILDKKYTILYILDISEFCNELICLKYTVYTGKNFLKELYNDIISDTIIIRGVLFQASKKLHFSAVIKKIIPLFI